MTYNIDPVDVFGETYRGEELVGGDAMTNARMAWEVLAGKDGACRKIVLLNAALAIMAAEGAENIQEGVARAEDCIGSRAAMKKLQELIDLTNS
jgi:anthranilate phosphoribosyltransferase